MVETLIRTVFKTVRRSRRACGCNPTGLATQPFHTEARAAKCIAVKARHAAPTLARTTKPCQRLGCVNFGKLRFQKRNKTVRTLHLCDPCLESLLPSQLSDLFLKFGVTHN